MRTEWRTAERARVPSKPMAVAMLRALQAFEEHWADKMRRGEVSGLSATEHLTLTIFLRWLSDRGWVLREPQS